MAIRRFEDLNGWQQARELTKGIYRASSTPAFRRDFALSDQVRRASISVMANIAEGFGRKGKCEFIRFLTIAQASSVELRSHLYVALDLGYVDDVCFEDLSSLAERCENLIGGLIRHLPGS